MTKYYVKPDSDGKFPDKDTTPVLEAADGLVEVSIPTTSIQYFTRYWWMYALLENGGVQAPGNLPDLSIDGLQSIIDQQGDQLDNAQDTIKTLQSMAGTLTQQQTELNATLKTANETITGLQSMAGTLMQQVTQLSTGTTQNTDTAVK